MLTEFKHKLNTKDKDDGLPIGTILTVPKSITRLGYIDYIEGKNFNRYLYPNLFDILGTDKFPFFGSEVNTLPIGTCLYLLNAEEVPSGFVEWNSSYGVLREYPELKKVLWKMANRIECIYTRNYWLEALDRNSFPLFSDFYFGIGSVGMMKEDSVKETKFNTLPLVIDDSHTLSTIGLRRCTVEKDVVPVMFNEDTIVDSYSQNNYVVIGQRADVYKNVDIVQHQHVMGKGNVTRPRTMCVRVIVKAVLPEVSDITCTHKRIIKAFEVINHETK